MYMQNLHNYVANHFQLYIIYKIMPYKRLGIKSFLIIL